MTFNHSATTRRTSPARTPPWWTQPARQRQLSQRQSGLEPCHRDGASGNRIHPRHRSPRL